jgi:hypothetical protein
MEEPALKQYTDVRIDALQDELGRRFATMMREMLTLITAQQRDLDSKIAGHNELHAREREP